MPRPCTDDAQPGSGVRPPKGAFPLILYPLVKIYTESTFMDKTLFSGYNGSMSERSETQRLSGDVGWLFIGYPSGDAV